MNLVAVLVLFLGVESKLQHRDKNNFHDYHQHFSTLSDTFGIVQAAEQQFTVPPNVNQMTVVMYGGRGGCLGTQFSGGNGARVRATFPVTPGTTYLYYIGGKGADSTGGAVGVNGGGSGNSGGGSPAPHGSPGGGATDIRTTSATNTRILVAGGGGGCDAWCSSNGGSSGLSGYAGTISGVENEQCGSGGTLFQLGSPGCSSTINGNPCGWAGSNNIGGSGFGGGGGGGFFGGKHYNHQNLFF